MKTLLFALLLFNSPVRAETIELRADLWCPFTCQPQSSEPGLMIEIAEKIFGSHGIKINYEVLNWARALDLTREGKIHGVVGASKGDAPDLLYPNVPQSVVYNEYYKNSKSDFFFKNAESLKNRKVALIKAYFYDEENAALQKTMKSSFVYLSGEKIQEQMIKMLLAGRIDAALESTAVFNWNLKNMKVPQGSIVSAGRSDPKPMELFVAFNPKHPKASEWAKMLDEGMRNLRKSGDLDKILSKYNFKDDAK
jgi:polar amino acid transport system substrate-binding protein